MRIKPSARVCVACTFTREKRARKVLADLRLLGLLLILLVTAPWCRAAEFQSAPREVWAGNYECGPMTEKPDRFPAYTAAVRLTLDNGDASITKESARIRETLSGKVAGDGHIVLQGTGQYKGGGGPNWRYRFEGSFEGERFEATGAMLTAARGTKLRDCSMSLRLVSRSQQAKQQVAPATRMPDKPAAATPPAQPESQPAAAPKPQPTPPAVPPVQAQEAPPSIRFPTAPPPTAVEPTAAAPAVPEQLGSSASVDSTQLGTRAEFLARLAQARARMAIELEASGKAASAVSKSATSPQSTSTGQSAPRDTKPATQ